MEGAQPLEDFIQKMLIRWLGLPPDRVFELEQAYCAPGGPNRVRAIVVRFKKFQDKVFIHRESRKKEIQYEGRKIAFVQDL